MARWPRAGGTPLMAHFCFGFAVTIAPGGEGRWGGGALAWALGTGRSQGPGRAAEIARGHSRGQAKRLLCDIISCICWLRRPVYDGGIQPATICESGMPCTPGGAPLVAHFCFGLATTGALGGREGGAGGGGGGGTALVSAGAGRTPEYCVVDTAEARRRALRKSVGVVLLRWRA
jgi:hypothetical protein